MTFSEKWAKYRCEYPSSWVKWIWSFNAIVFVVGALILTFTISLDNQAAGQSYWQYGGGVYGGAPGSASTCNIFIPGTTTGVGAGCLPSATLNAVVAGLNNPQNPIQYGADPTGMQDSTAAISSALSAGDVHFIAGPQGSTYLTNACQDCTSGSPPTPWSFCTGAQACSGVTNVSSGACSGGPNYGLRPPAGRTILCDPGVVIKSSLTPTNSCQSPNNHDAGYFDLFNNNIKIVGCTFSGVNTAVPAGFGTNGASTLYALDISGGTGDVVEGNTFGNNYGNGAIEFTPNVGTSTSTTITYNTFKNNAYYGIVVAGVVGGSGSIDHNLAWDNPIGAEFDSCGTQGNTLGSGMTITLNFVRYDDNVGNCQSVINGNQSHCGDTAGGNTSFEGEAYTAASTCNYSGITFGPNNYCLGGTAITTHFNGGFGGTNSTNSNLATFPGTNYALGAHCTCANMTGAQTCP